MADAPKKVELYGLSTCGWCRKAKAWLDEHGVEHTCVYMDQITPDEKAAAKERIKSFVDRLSVPIILVNDGEKIIQGYKPDKFEECLK